MLCVLILYISSGTYCLKSTTNDRFFEKLFMVIWFTLRVFARNLLRGNHRRNTFCILFWCLAWDSNLGFTSNKPTHYLVDYGDFHYSILLIFKIWSTHRTHTKQYAWYCRFRVSFTQHLQESQNKYDSHTVFVCYLFFSFFL